MKKQLDLFNSRYDYSMVLNKIKQEEQEELHILRKIIDDIVNDISNGMIVQYPYVLKQIKKHEDLRKLKSKRVASVTIIGMLLCESDELEWINCGCGDIGKFKKVSK